MVVGFCSCGWYVSYGFEESLVVGPVDVVEGGVLDVADCDRPLQNGTHPQTRPMEERDSASAMLV